MCAILYLIYELLFLQKKEAEEDTMCLIQYCQFRYITPNRGLFFFALLSSTMKEGDVRQQFTTVARGESHVTSNTGSIGQFS